MAITQIHTPELYPGIVFNTHVNVDANIDGYKVKQATISARGTVTLAEYLGILAGTVVQASDPRMHLPNTDTGTTSKTFTINSNPVAGDASTLILNSIMVDGGGAFRYNEDAGRVEFTNNYNGLREWHPIASCDDLGNGIIYRTHKMGYESDDYPSNTLYSLVEGAFPISGTKLVVFVNGQFKSSLAGDYSIVDTDTIEFTNPRSDTDNIEMLVYADIIYRICLLGSQADDPAMTQFSVSGVSFLDNTVNVLVFLDGIFRCQCPPPGVEPDYTFLDDNTIQFLYELEAEDVVEIIVVTVGSIESLIGRKCDCDGTSATTFRIANTSNDMGEYYLLFGNGDTQNIGLRSYYGRLQIRELNGLWTNILNNPVGLPSGTSGYLLEADPSEPIGVKWVDPDTLYFLPPGTDSYMLIANNDVWPPVEWIPQPVWQPPLPVGLPGQFLMYDPSVVGSVRWVWWWEGMNGWSGISDCCYRYCPYYGQSGHSGSGWSGSSGYFISIDERILIIDQGMPNRFAWISIIDLQNPTVDTNGIIVIGNVFNTLSPYRSLTDNVLANNGDYLMSFISGLSGITSPYIWMPLIDCGEFTVNYNPLSVIDILPVNPNDAVLEAGHDFQALIMYPPAQTGLAWTNTIDCGEILGFGTSGASAYYGSTSMRNGDLLISDISNLNNLGWARGIDCNLGYFDIVTPALGCEFNNIPAISEDNRIMMTVYQYAGVLTGFLHWGQAAIDCGDITSMLNFGSQIVMSPIMLSADILPIGPKDPDYNVSCVVMLDSHVAGGAKWTNTIDCNLS